MSHYSVECLIDDDDERAVNTAVAHFQASRRWPEAEGGGIMLPDGDSDLRGAILSEICREWLAVQVEERF